MSLWASEERSHTLGSMQLTLAMISDPNSSMLWDVSLPSSSVFTLQLAD